MSALYTAAAMFEGRHDFAAFTNNPRDKVKAEILEKAGRVRNIRKVEGGGVGMGVGVCLSLCGGGG